MNTPKPQYCQQNWLRMNEVPGGRVCSSCEKKIIDFTGKTWKEISALQTANNNELCGLYSQKQLDHWGHQAPSIGFNTKAIAAVSSLLLSISPAAAQVHDTPKIEVLSTDSVVVEKSVERADSTKHVCTIKGKITDAETGEPLGFVNVYNTANIGVVSDMEGNYTIQILVDDSLAFNDTLVFSMIGYAKERLTGLPFSKSEITFDVALSSEEVLITAFYVTPISRTRRVWYRLTKPFRRKR